MRKLEPILKTLRNSENKTVSVASHWTCASPNRAPGITPSRTPARLPHANMSSRSSSCAPPGFGSPQNSNRLAPPGFGSPQNSNERLVPPGFNSPQNTNESLDLGALCSGLLGQDGELERVGRHLAAAAAAAARRR